MESVHEQMPDCVDIQLVKEQLRLLGHCVSNDIIMSFMQGMGLCAGGAQQQGQPLDAACDADACGGEESDFQDEGRSLMLML